MSEADKMFEELGYEEKNFDTGIINFIKEYGKETQSNIHFWEEEKTISKNGDIDSVRITMQELKAINKKCEELGVDIMIAKYIKLMDDSFESVEILNVKDEEDLMHKIKEGEIIKIQDGAFICGVNSNYIMIYEL